jgi:transposase
MKRNQSRAHRAPDPASLAPKACGTDLELYSRGIGVLPIVNRIIRRCRLRDVLTRHLPTEDRRNRVSTATAVLLLVRNILISREPLYGIGQWAAAFVPELLDLREDQLKNLNDDRVGRALDRLFDADLSQLAMHVVRNVVAEFDLDLSELHNDSTTVRFYGDYEDSEGPRRGKLPAALRHGHSKDHRPDLKQLLYILTVTNDGGVPIYFTTEDGDRPDDVTHIPTWNLLRELTGRADFLYVADCKLAGSENLRHIHSQGGRFITILPRNRNESKEMRKRLQESPESMRWELLYEVEDAHGNLTDCFRVNREDQITADGYRLLWIHSTAKATSDEQSRMRSIRKTTEELTALRDRLVSPRSRMRDRTRVTEAVAAILEKRDVGEWIEVEILEREEVTMKQAGRGRPGEKTRYRREVKKHFDLTWELNAEQLETARRSDGVFPLVTNDIAMPAIEVLRAYKRQPVIEKRFSQLKTDFQVAPVYLKEVSRIESLLAVYFLALLVQTLLERELRRAMKSNKLESLPLYPESRPCRRPTARRVIDVMEPLARHRLVTEDGASQDLYTQPTPIQRQLIKLYGLDAASYGRSR